MNTWIHTRMPNEAVEAGSSSFLTAPLVAPPGFSDAIAGHVEPPPWGLYTLGFLAIVIADEVLEIMVINTDSAAFYGNPGPFPGNYHCGQLP